MKKLLKSGVFISIAFFVMTICVFGPLELYITNQSELWFGFTDALLLSGIMCAVALIVLAAISFLLRGKACSLFAALLFGCTLCLYIQGNYLNINYGLLDGKTIDWGGHSIYAILDTAFWIIVLVATVFLWVKKAELFSKIQRYASMFIIAMQVLTLCVLILSGGVLTTDDESSSYLSTENLYTLGNEENIVILVLDAFDEAYMEALLENEPEKYLELFQDFTHYTNVVVGGATTYSAMPIIITGKNYPGEVSYKHYITSAFNSDGLYSELKKQGYQINFFTEDDFIPNNAGDYVANLVTGSYRINSHLGLTKKYGTLTMYKYMPHLLKRFFWLYTGEFDAYKEADSSEYEAYTINDTKTYSDLVEQRLQTVDGKCFTLIHMSGAHPPYSLNENAQYQENVSIEQKCKGSLHIVAEYLEQMKALGIYESSTVIIMSDHGQLILPRGMMMIKRPYASGYQLNDAPISHFDLHNTLFELIGIKKGDSIFDIPEGIERTRMYYPQSSQNGTFYMTEYAIQGNPRDVMDGTATGVVLSPTRTKMKYVLGTPLTCGSDGTINPYVEKGLNTLHVDYSWTDGNEIIFRFELDSLPKENLSLALTYNTVYLKINDQYLGIYVDDELMFSETLTSTASRTITIDIPKEKAADGELVVRLDLPDAKSPANVLGVGNDPHVLGLALTGLCISELHMEDVPNYTMGKRLTFGCDSNVDAYVVNGLSHSSTMAFAWTNGPETLFRIPIDKKPVADLQVTINLTSVFSQFGSQRITIKVNDMVCYTNTLNEAKDIVFTIPSDAVKDDLLSMWLYLPDAKSPYDETGEGDRRTLGMAITGLCIEPCEP